MDWFGETERKKREMRKAFASKTDSVALREMAEELNRRENGLMTEITFKHADKKWRIKELG